MTSCVWSLPRRDGRGPAVFPRYRRSFPWRQPRPRHPTTTRPGAQNPTRRLRQTPVATVRNILRSGPAGPPRRRLSRCRARSPAVRPSRRRCRDGSPTHGTRGCHRPRGRGSGPSGGTRSRPSRRAPGRNSSAAVDCQKEDALDFLGGCLGSDLLCTNTGGGLRGFSGRVSGLDRLFYTPG